MMSGRKDVIAAMLVGRGWRRRYCTEPERGAIVLDRPHGTTGVVWSVAFGPRGAVYVRGVNGETLHRVPASLPDDEITLSTFERWLPGSRGDWIPAAQQ